MKRPVIRFCLDGDFASISKLDGITDEINEDLGQAATIAVPWWQLRSDLDFESELLIGRQRLKGTAHSLGNILNAVIRQFEHQLTGLDLGQIEHIIDQAEQMLAVT